MKARKSLGELAADITVGYVGSMATEYIEEGVPFLRSLNIKPYSYEPSDLKYISREFHKKIKKSSLKPGDVVAVRTGNPGASCVIPDELNEANCSDLVVIRCGDLLDPYFVSYYINSVTHSHVKNQLVGAIQKHFNIGSAKELPFPDLTKNQQEKISIVLRAIDKKIELNNRINAELEAMAKTLYDYWFVQFNFPDANDKPYKTSGGKMVYNSTLKREIPEGWEAVSVGKIVDIKTGKEDANYATEGGKYHFFTCGESALRCDDFVFEGKAVLLAGNGSFSVKRYEGKFNAYQRTYVLIPKQDELYAPLYFAVNDKVKTLTSGSRGSIVKFITKGDIEDIYLPIPVKRELDFAKSLNIFFNESSRLYEQNLELVTLRDWLLPMLMNGQVTVK